ncbi:hypothetical protein XOCgx_1920 [Xanthomonas oryzae pv. oryzicola]|nr:hypothetical protein XOCgx_1920 [Xanthomonas oryzae pv. oryzicola]
MAATSPTLAMRFEEGCGAAITKMAARQR